MVQTALVIAALLRFATAEGTWDRNSDPIVAGKSESNFFAEPKGSLSEYVLENALARLNERPDDVILHLMGMRGNEALSSNLVLAVDGPIDKQLFLPYEKVILHPEKVHVAIDIGYEPLEPCGDKKEGQISRYVALPPSLSRYSHMDIRCLNLQLCQDPMDQGFKIPCLYDTQRQLELSYQEEKANLLQDLKARLKSLEETIIGGMGKENLNPDETKEAAAAAAVEENTEVKEKETNTTDNQDQDTQPKAGEDGSLSDMFSDAAENFLDFKDDPFFDADDSESELKSLGQDKEDPYAEPEQEPQQEDTKPEAKIGGDWRLRLAVNGVDEFHPDRE